jgi:DNA repair exonuclease SbcCD ATPase subunit
MKINKLKLENFKGFESFEINFDEKTTNIYGDNGTGKTSISDAILWLLFGKLTDGSAQLKDIQPEKNGITIPDIIVNVEAIFDNFLLKKQIKQNKKKIRGLETDIISNEVLYFIDDIPKTKRDYELFINSQINEDTFKLITSPNYFFTLKENEQRQKIMSLVQINEQDIIEKNKLYQNLFSGIKGQSLIEYRKYVATTKRKIKEQIKSMQPRIDELSKQIDNSIDFNSVQLEKKQLEKDIAEIDKSLLSIEVKEQSILDHNNKIECEILELENKANEEKDKITLENNKKLSTLKDEYINLEKIIASKLDEKIKLSSFIKENEDKAQELRDKWHEINNSELNDSVDTICPTCKQELPKENIEFKKKEIRTNFENNKKRQLEEISSTGKHRVSLAKEKKQEYDEIVKELQQLQPKLKELLNKKTSFKPKQFDSTKIQQKIDNLKKQIKHIQSDSELLNNRNSLNKELIELNKKLSIQDNNKKLNQRIEEIKIESKKLSQQQFEYDEIEQTIINYNKDLIESIEYELNSLFEITTFKMFETIMSTGEEKEACIALCGENGISYSAANAGLKINVGIDICNVFAKKAGIKAPIIIDNAESVTKLIHTDSQLIRLIVSELDKTLRI